MHARTVWCWLAALLVMLFSASSGLACDCAGAPKPCEAFWETEAIFSGTVRSQSGISVVRGEGSNKYTIQEVLVRFQLGEVFRGELAGPEMEVVTGMGGGDCGYHFERDKKYLVYASRHGRENHLYTGICTRTRLLSEASEDLTYFHNLPPAGSGSTIVVSVKRYMLPVGDDSRFEITPIPGVKVTADGADKHFEGQTNNDGQYEFVGLQPGTYKVKADLPPNPRSYSTTEVAVIDRGCAHREFVNHVGGNISGRVLEASGNPVSGAKVDLIAVDDMFTESPKGKWRFTNSAGLYSLDDVPPGNYLLGINLIAAQNAQCPRTRTYYPSGSDPSQATVVMLTEGRQLKDVDVRMMSGPPEVELEGFVVWPNGRPAVHAVVGLANGTEPHYLIGDQKIVDSKGHFVLKGLQGCSYQVRAFTYGGRVSANSDEVEESRHSEPVTVTLSEKKPQPLRLVLTSPGFDHRDDEKRSPQE